MATTSKLERFKTSGPLQGKHDCFYSEAEFQQMFPIPVSVRSTHVEIDEDILDLGNGLRKLRCTNRGGRIRHVLSACRDR